MVKNAKTLAQSMPIGNNRSRERHDVPGSPSEEQEQKRALARDIQHLHGPGEITYEKDELMVLVVLRDGRPYIKSFVEHYLEHLGAKHIVFLDNGSDDGTVEALREYENGVSVFRTTLPFKQYQISMRQYLVERFGGNRWTLSVDIDELFEYPYSDVVGLGELLGYLNERGYTAVVSHLLDMFPERISSETTTITEDEPLKKSHRFYDISNVSAYPYRFFNDLGNVVSNEDIEFFQNGVQSRLFGIHPLLTKHPLIFFDGEAQPYDLSEHWAGGVRVADFTGVLLHYKLSASLYGLVRREMKERTYPNRHGKYDKYLKVLEENSGLQIKDENSKELGSVNELVGTHFVTVSEDYLDFVEGESRKNGSQSLLQREFLEAFFNAGREAREQAGRVDNLQQHVDKLREQEKRARERLEWVEQQTQVIRQQIEAVQSSRTWKTLTVLSKFKTATFNELGRLSKKDRSGDRGSNARL